MTAGARVHALLETQRRVLELIATGSPLDDVLNELVLGMERQHADMRGSILLLAEDGVRMRSAAAPHLDVEYQRLVEHHMMVGPAMGSCGTACYRRERVITTDIATDPLWAPYTEIAKRFGLAACWSEPIFSRTGEVLGSFAMYYPSVRSPSEHALECIFVAARLAAIAIDRARSDAALQRSTKRLNFALDAAKMGTWEWDVATNRVTWSDSVERLFDLPLGSFKGSFEEYLRLIPEPDRALVEKAVRDSLAGPTSDYLVEHRIELPDGAFRFLECKGRVYRTSGGVPTHMAGTVADISDRKRAESALRQSEELLRQSHKMEAIGRLAGGVAHDFNNLLTAIGGFSALCLLEMQDNDPRREYLEEIQHAGARGAGLTKQLLAFGRKQVLSPQLVDVNGIVENLTALLARVIGEDIAFEWQPCKEPAVVLADPGQIEQIIMNLSVNARDAMPRGGRLVINSSHLKLGSELARASAVPPGSYVRITVRDSGHGMSRETLSHIFEPFFTTKELGKGTGLGLSTTYGIVEQLSGVIRAESELGQGTLFEVYLPAQDTAGFIAKGASAVPRARGGTETILLVEDEPQVRELVLQVLKAQGYQVIWAMDGAHALTQAHKHSGPIHLLLTDVVMPGMSGRELAERLAGTHAGTRVLFMSGYTDDAVLRHGVSAPGTAFLQKPFALEQLLTLVRQLLDAPAR